MNNTNKPVYVFTFTYQDNRGKTVEVSKTDLAIYGLETETSNLDIYNENPILEKLIIDYGPTSKPIIREKLPNGNLSAPIEHAFIEKVIRDLELKTTSLSNATKRYSSSDIVYH